MQTWEMLVNAVPGSQVRREGGAVGVVTGIRLGGFNGVWGESRDVDPRAVGRLLDWVRAAGMPHSMTLRPGWAPEVGTIAHERGLVRVPGEPVMVSEDAALLLDALGADGLSVRQLAPEDGVLHARVAAVGEVTGNEAHYRTVTAPEVLGTPGFRCYVGEVAGQAVTTALSVSNGDYVGIFSVATLPDHRRRGYGGAVTARAARDGFGSGARWAWLSASEAGYPVYRRLGFATVEQLDLWEGRRS